MVKKSGGSCGTDLRADDPITSVTGSGDSHTMTVDTSGHTGGPLSDLNPSEFDR